MEPLSASASIRPEFSKLPTNDASSSKSDLRAGSDQAQNLERKIELNHKVVNATEAVPQDVQARPSASEEKSNSLERVEVELKDPPDLQVESENLGVTYTVRPELTQKFQGEIVNRETSETEISVPSESQIKLAEALGKYVGTQVDVLA